MDEDPFTDAEHELAWVRNQALVARVRRMVLSAIGTRARAEMKWHLVRGRRLVRELHVVRGIAAPLAKPPVSRRGRGRRTGRVHLRAVRT